MPGRIEAEQLYENLASLVRFHLTRVDQQSGNAFRDKFPGITETIVANMQVRFQEGFEGRLEVVLPRLSRAGGTA